MTADRSAHEPAAASVLSGPTERWVVRGPARSSGMKRRRGLGPRWNSQKIPSVSDCLNGDGSSEEASQSSRRSPWSLQRLRPRLVQAAPWTLVLQLSLVLLYWLLSCRLFCSPEIFLQNLVTHSPELDAPADLLGSFINDRDGNIAIFYNIFIPADQGRQGVARALDIVEEQMAQIGTSVANHPGGTDRNTSLTVFYTTIGLPGAITPSFMHQHCHVKYGIQCRHLGHALAGFEELSLEPLHQLCRQHVAGSPTSDRHRDTHARLTVIYLHSKGSFHSQRGENDVWRRHMTRAVTSESCLQSLTSASTCNVCGLLFYPLWSFFFPGNVWAADCQYVAQLESPLRHRAKLETAVERLRRDNRSLWRTTLFETGPGYMGVGRYSSEHWIASHPRVVPCDVSQTAELEYWWHHPSDQQPLPWAWSLAPRHDISSPYFRLNHTRLRHILSDATRTNQEYFWLTGFLYKWLVLYGEAPPPDSWIWTWFPDGQHWRNVVERFGNESVDVLLSGSY